MKYIIARLKEAGTWRILAAAVTGIFGVAFTDGQVELGFQIVSGALLLWEASTTSGSTVEKNLGQKDPGAPN